MIVWNGRSGIFESIRVHPRKDGVSLHRCATRPSRAIETWTVDFLHDLLAAKLNTGILAGAQSDVPFIKLPQARVPLLMNNIRMKNS